MKKISIILISFIFIALLNKPAIAQPFYACKDLYKGRKYNAASKCFYQRINENSNDVESRFWYAASLYYDRQLSLSYAQYNYIAQKYPNSNIGKYSKKEAEKVKNRIKHIENAKAKDTGSYTQELSHRSKWTQMPIRVWIQPSSYTASAKKAFDEWQTKSGGIVRFAYVDNQNAAKIKVSFVDKLDTSDADKNIGFTTLKYVGNKNISADVKILRKTQANLPKSNMEIYPVILHEIGHALGLSGHSKNNNDIMYPNDFTNDVHLSNRDINTLRAIYSSR